MAFYLKYRPQTLDQLIGQEAVKNVLSASIASNKLSHAYLFVGARGTGKTSTARILAKMVNCLDKEKRPCNKCASCLSITDGSNLDLIEIDAASNRGIDDIRSLRDKVKLSPTQSLKKVYIIDEVHMLTTEAFNALLKTLEEPPAHALFILATTESAKIPKTILSRVQRLDFKLATTQDLLQAFKRVVEEEKMSIDEGGLKFLAKKAEGSFRDGIKLLDQVSSIEGIITAEKLEQVIKGGQSEEIFELLDNLLTKNAKTSLQTLHKILESGADAKILTNNLMDVLRSIVFIKNGLGESLVESQFSEEDFVKLKNFSVKFTNQDLIKVLNLLQESLEKLKFTSIVSLPLELVLVEICNSIEQVDKQLAVEKATDVKSVEDSHLSELPAGDEFENQTQINEGAIRVLDQSENIVNSPSDDIRRLKEKWNFVLETVRPYNFSLEALLRSIKIAECSEHLVLMEVPYSFHQRILEATKNREILESIISDILGRKIRVTTALGIRPKRLEDIANVEVAQDDEIIRAAVEIFSSDSIN